MQNDELNNKLAKEKSIVEQLKSDLESEREEHAETKSELRKTYE